MGLLRMMQGQVLKKIKGAGFEKRRDQRELIKVCQRNFREYMALRDWGWFVIIQKTRPLIGMPDPTEELRLLEEKAQATWGVYKEKLDTKERLLQENVLIEDEKKALMKQIDSEQGNMSQYHERQAKISAEKADLEVELATTQDKLVKAEQTRVQATNDKKDLELETVAVKKDIGDVEMVIQKLEQEKTNRDHTIKSLNDEIANQDEIINKLNKEKKHVSESGAKATEAEIERSRKELEAQVGRKDNDMIGLQAKLDDEQTLVSKVQKGIKELQGRIEQMEEELEAERQARAKAERQRSDLAREMESLSERLNEACGATAAQVELNKKRDAEVSKLRKDSEEAHIQREATVVGMKKKQQDACAEMTEQIDQLTKMKAKVEHDKGKIIVEIADVRAATDEVARSKASAEKSYRSLVVTLNELNKKGEEANLNLGDIEGGKRRLTAENADLLRQLQELQNNANLLLKTKSALVSALDEQKAIADNEAKERVL